MERKTGLRLRRYIYTYTYVYIVKAKLFRYLRKNGKADFIQGNYYSGVLP